MGLKTLKKNLLILANDFKVRELWNVFEYMVYISLYIVYFQFFRLVFSRCLRKRRGMNETEAGRLDCMDGGRKKKFGTQKIKK